MDIQVNQKFQLFLTSISVAVTAILLYQTPRLSLGLVFFACAYVAVILLRDYILKVALQQKKGLWYMHAQLILILILYAWSESYVTQVYLLILVGEYAYHHPLRRALVFSLACFVSNIAAVLLYRESNAIFAEVYFLFPRSIGFFAFFLVGKLARSAYLQKRQLAAKSYELQVITKEMERSAALQERTRISRDLHDSVGYTLTSALVGLQTAELALQKNEPTLAQDMIERIKDNVRNGLEDVRTTLHSMRTRSLFTPFASELVKLIEDLKKQTQVQVEYTIDDELPTLPPAIESTILRALQEGLTNGVRHGSSTFFHFSLMYKSGFLYFRLSDNGKLNAAIVPGFGLNAMKERVQAASGLFAVTANESTGGVTVEITIPLHEHPQRRGDFVG
ncbi:sensor histidine kinase [Paenibacillus sp. HB172176]|uniref:sensor histidine kinase n=1 Tax=Paenibacillus sp. HB172176 TaxID=2493690 RepID=UPI00143CA0D5|nr:sensor histidine kinase [Paenibacillus sp. HB172176]